MIRAGRKCHIIGAVRLCGISINRHWLSAAEPLGIGRCYFGRPFVYLTPLAGLVFVGFFNSYLHNAAFGSESYFEYLSLFL
jgi:hypothetical protein